MDRTTRASIERFVEENITKFHVKRVENLNALRLGVVLKNKNPNLFRAKNLNLAPELINALLDARLSSSEEGSFGTFLEELAIFVAQLTSNGQKSAVTGVDIELTRDKTRYLIAVKSGKNWGNASQHAALKQNFKTAVRVLRQSKYSGAIQPTLGISYGNFKTTNTGEYLHIGGQSFWNLISGDPNFYIEIVEPLGHESEKHDKLFSEQKSKTYNRLIREFTIEYCDTSGAIDWARLVQFVSGNLDEQ